MTKNLCGERLYANIDKAKIDKILKALRDNGATVTGDNPWDVDTHKHGVKLRGSWNASTSTLSIIVTDKSWYVPCSRIWATIDELIHHIREAPLAELEEASEALAVAGTGKCGERRYGNINQTKIDKILKALRDNGATVTGNNPWDVDTHKHGVKLRGSWNASTSTLSIIVTAKNFYVPCSKIWATIEELIRHIQSISLADLEESAESAADSADGKCGVRRYGNITQGKIDRILKALRDNGATVTGNNPWDVDTHKHGVKLRGTWDAATSTLSIIVTGKNFYVPCSRIWAEIDSLIHHISGLGEEL